MVCVLEVMSALAAVNPQYFSLPKLHILRVVIVLYYADFEANLSGIQLFVRNYYPFVD